MSCALHHKCLTPEDLVPPLLHMEIGMVNQVWDSFQMWIDDDIERVPVDEKATRELSADAKRYLDFMTSEKEEARKKLERKVL